MSNYYRYAVFAILCCLFAFGAEMAGAQAAGFPDQYNIVWNSQSKNSGESMPVGGHDIGLNVWVEDGDILFYVGQSGCRDENGSLLKHGRVRVHLNPNPFAEGGKFRQELKLRQSCIEISGKAKNAPEATVRIWVEVGRPVVHLDIEAQKSVETNVTFESWRYFDRELPQGGSKMGPRGMSMMNRDSYPGDVWLYSDTVEPEPDHIVWFHRMRNDKGVFGESVQQQHLEDVKDKLYDPLTNLTFGGMLEGDNLSLAGETEGVYAQTSYKGWRYNSNRAAGQHHIRLLCHINQAGTVEKWKQELHQLAAKEHPTHDEAWQNNLIWWNNFWQRSHIVINSGAEDDNRPWQVGRNYNLFRYMLACNLSGREPTMFNGGLFTYDPLYVGGPAASRAGADAVDQGFTPDHRQWGAGFTAQNQRLLYWPMLRSDDFDVMQPGLDFYRHGLASAKSRVKQYWGHEGACFVEQISAQALPGMAMWGYVEGGNRSRPENFEHGLQVNGATRYLYQAQLEFAYMMLQWHHFSGWDIEPYLPFIDAAVRFYDQHYQMRKQKRDGKPLDENGHIVIAPSIACESYEGASNPADAVAGLHAVLGRLVKPDHDWISTEEKEEYRDMLKRIPPLPVMHRKGKQVFAPAASWNNAHDKEIPELYPVFPYDLSGLRQENFEMALDTWKYTPGSKDHISWHQGNIFCARLGLAEEAAEYAIKKLADSERRFPTFWGPGHDWVPDHNWGGSGMIGLQEMLMQTIENQILLFPAWPEEWDVDFKLHAPQQTVVEAKVSNGKIVELKVTPGSRRKDIIIPEPMRSQ